MPIPRFMPGTNCIVALLSPRHDHHERALGEMERRLDKGETLVVAAHTLVETYSVLTRLPAPHRLSSADCRALIEANVAPDMAEVIALPTDGYRRLIHDAPASNLSGGRVYAACLESYFIGRSQRPRQQPLGWPRLRRLRAGGPCQHPSHL